MTIDARGGHTGTIGGPGTMVDSMPSCTAPGATKDERALFLAAFGPR